MTKRIITISREFGSGGRFIGEEVAKKLGIAYYAGKNTENQSLIQCRRTESCQNDGRYR